MINYLFIDEKNKTHSVAEYEGEKVNFWNMLFSEYSIEEVEAFIKAEALLRLNRKEEISEIIQPFISGENTYITSNQSILDDSGEPLLGGNGVSLFTTVQSGYDSRSFLKKWADDNL
jgi:hypothetical protein